MSLKSIHTDILNTLTDLDKDDFKKFRFQLQDPAEKPRIRAGEVEGKSRVVITKLLVSRCTEAGALDRTIRTLRVIGCNNEAQKLESKASLGPSPKPLTARANEGPGISQNEKKVTAIAKKTLKYEQTLLLFGKYKEKSFKWLLENDVRYAAYVVGSHQIEREEWNNSQTPLMQNKDALAEYVTHFPEAMEEVKFYCEGQATLGFGKYKDETREDLYNSTDDEKKSYVKYLRGKEKSCTKGSLMEAAIKYILHRDQKGPAVSSTCSTSANLQKSRATRKRAHPDTELNHCSLSRSSYSGNPNLDEDLEWTGGCQLDVTSIPYVDPSRYKRYNYYDDEPDRDRDPYDDDSSEPDNREPYDDDSSEPDNREPYDDYYW